MEDLYIKPGNQDRGWNDPPQFSYGLQTQGGPKRNLLNKRVPPPQLSGSQSPVPGVTPPASHSTPPSNPLAPPPCGVATPPRSLSVKGQSDTPTAQSENEPSIDDVIGVLTYTLTACRRTAKKQVCDDVARRLKLFEDAWRDGRLSLPVRRRMDLLAQEMRSQKWDSADEIHRALMVDFPGEVSQWMVGVKRLICEARSVSPDVPNTAPSDPLPDASHGGDAAT
ncbi:steroid receptor RNA activator 1 [Brienomyrus brachyistius]|uniref:steroid receptor RNA activator 1 n=1 Tax=Brienomyrus brachyistius TaxID=42636 RepID=UPI0020B1CAF1|nr:steroid receptor RNA activator 1 [Brienomyrus brachyistius]